MERQMTNFDLIIKLLSGDNKDVKEYFVLEAVLQYCKFVLSIPPNNPEAEVWFNIAKSNLKALEDDQAETEAAKQVGTIVVESKS